MEEGCTVPFQRGGRSLNITITCDVSAVLTEDHKVFPFLEVPAVMVLAGDGFRLELVSTGDCDLADDWLS